MSATDRIDNAVGIFFLGVVVGLILFALMSWINALHDPSPCEHVLRCMDIDVERPKCEQLYPGCEPEAGHR